MSIQNNIHLFTGIFLSIWKYGGHIWKRIINIVKSGLIQAWKF